MDIRNSFRLSVFIRFGGSRAGVAVISVSSPFPVAGRVADPLVAICVSIPVAAPVIAVLIAAAPFPLAVSVHFSGSSCCSL
jgi:hypothetical protein